MTRKTSILSAGYFSFMILAYVSSVISGALSLILYFLAFSVPFILAYFADRDDSDRSVKYFKLDALGTKTTLLVLFPSVFAVLSVSLITNLIIPATIGITNSANLGDSLVFALVYHAIFPAVMEEMLFRYLPLKLLSGYSRRGAVLLSAVFFAMVHRNVFSIPYAFVGGVIFMTLDIVTDSVLPSIIIHFINNLLSVLMIFFGDNNVFAISFYSFLILGTTISVIFLIKNKTVVKENISYAFSSGDRVTATPSLCLFLGASLIMTILNLF